MTALQPSTTTANPTPLPNSPPGDHIGPGDILLLMVRLAIAIALCMGFVTAVLVVGWVTRWMQRAIHRGWWRASPARPNLSWRQYASEQPTNPPFGLTPRWLVHERAAQLWTARRPDGRPPGWITRIARAPAILVGGLAANARAGLTMLLATFLLTAPGSFLMLAGWQYGWDISFHKVYEQAFIGRITFLIGAAVFVSALLYLPLATPHLAASGRLRDFFQVRLIRRLGRHARLGLTLYAALVVLLSLPAYLAWLRIYELTNEPAFAWLQDATPEQVHAFRDGYAANMTLLIAPAYLIVHLAAAAIYRRSLPLAIAREPHLREELPPALSQGLERLELVASPADRRPMLLIRAVLGTARKGLSIALASTRLVLWILLVLIMIIAHFIHAHPFLIWFNPWLLGLPCARWYPSW